MKSMTYVEGRPGTWRNFPNLLISCPSIAQCAPIPLPLIVGYGFLEHGFAKAARGFDAFPAILQPMALPAPHSWGSLTIALTILAGFAGLLGALVPLVRTQIATV